MNSTHASLQWMWLEVGASFTVTLLVLAGSALSHLPKHMKLAMQFTAITIGMLACMRLTNVHHLTSGGGDMDSLGIEHIAFGTIYAGIMMAVIETIRMGRTLLLPLTAAAALAPLIAGSAILAKRYSDIPDALLNSPIDCFGC